MKLVDVDEILACDPVFDLFDDAGLADPEVLRNRLVPPLPVNGRRLVWGFPLCRQARQEGVAALYGKEVSGDDSDLLSLALRMEGKAGSYSWPEKERLLEFMEKRCAPDRRYGLEELIQPGGGLDRQVGDFRSLSLSLRLSVERGLVDLKTARFAAGIPESAAVLFLEKAGRFSFSVRKQILRNCFEIMTRNGLSAPETESLLEKVLAAEEPAPLLRELRMPGLAAMENEFRRTAGAILKRTGIRIDPPPHFEGGSFTFSFAVDSREGLEKRIAALETIREKADDLFRFLR